jgi:hypothetical protein
MLKKTHSTKTKYNGLFPSNVTTKCLKTKEIEAAAKEYNTWSCLALISTSVGHVEDPDEATLVQQHANQHRGPAHD